MCHFCACREEKENGDDDDLSESAVTDDSLGLRVYLLGCECVYMRLIKCTLILGRLNHCNVAFMPGELCRRGHLQ